MNKNWQFAIKKYKIFVYYKGALMPMYTFQRSSKRGKYNGHGMSFTGMEDIQEYFSHYYNPPLPTKEAA